MISLSLKDIRKLHLDMIDNPDMNKDKDVNKYIVKNCIALQNIFSFL